MFFAYSFAGWCCEVALTSIEHRHFINRGFLIGPYCPIYGTGGTLITLLLSKFQGSYLAIFTMSMVACTTLEYIVSWLMEELFQARWWDYTDKPFNINGRVWLGNAVLFGLGGCFVIEIINPIFYDFLSHFQINTLIAVTIILIALFILDFGFSFYTIYNFRNEAQSITKDATEEIVAMVKEETQQFKEHIIDEFEIKVRKLRYYTQIRSEEIRLRFDHKSYMYRRLVRAYPRMELRGKNLKKIRQEIQKHHL